jgi:hypothetical protein
VLAQPAALPPLAGEWGRIAQAVKRDGESLQWRQEVRFDKRVLSVADFDVVRGAMNRLRAESARTLLLQPND